MQTAVLFQFSVWICHWDPPALRQHGGAVHFHTALPNLVGVPQGKDLAKNKHTAPVNSRALLQAGYKAGSTKVRE